MTEPCPPRLQPFVDKMSHHGAPAQVVAAFTHHFECLASGDPGLVSESEIRPVGQLPDASSLGNLARTGERALGRLVVIKLNGGLGTSMGLDRAKSLLSVRDGLSFLDLIARQILSLRAHAGVTIPLLLMNSFRTRDDAEEALRRYPDLPVEGLPIDFLQHRIPKVLQGSLSPAEHPAAPELEWCPPGHGDLYPALLTSGLLPRLLDRAYEYAFVSNGDNLGAWPDPRLLGLVIDSGATFLMEVADRTPADSKGGHLCRLEDGRLCLRESAQCPPDEVRAFQDVTRHRYFNTNNLWIHLPTLRRLLDSNGGFLPLPTLVNRKPLDPRDDASPPVFQLETAVGAAIALFPSASAVRIPRSRFSPVKTTNDLLAVRSDAYHLDPGHRLRLDPRRSAPPTIDLDPHFFRLVDAFDARFPHGPPSLLECRSLAVRGDVTFGHSVTVRGSTSVRGTGARARVEDGAILEGMVEVRGSPSRTVDTLDGAC